MSKDKIIKVLVCKPGLDGHDRGAKINQWTPEITKVNSKTGENFDKLLKLINKHKTFLQDSGVISNYMEQKNQNP
ncbi:unnamed protein product [marine sediment metagenome]|uniref:B12-binding domain-containing protein n=1 Tax=marine sediment metagenome TaxID=412755 RepID=X1ALU7_9ZZZZ